MSLLPRSFYTRENVVLIARELLGKVIVTRREGATTAGVITETEAYAGVTDRASHAFNGRRTERTEIMYRVGGTAYIYLCYGMHSLFNVVTHGEGTPHAVLVRGIEPLEGREKMLARCGREGNPAYRFDGPGKVSKALALHYSDTGWDLTVKPGNKADDGIWIEDRGFIVAGDEIAVTPRIGVDYAGADAGLPYRFLWRRQ